MLRPLHRLAVRHLPSPLAHSSVLVRLPVISSGDVPQHPLVQRRLRHLGIRHCVPLPPTHRKAQSIRVHIHRTPPHASHTHRVMRQQHPIQFLNHACRCRAAQPASTNR